MAVIYDRDNNTYTHTSVPNNYSRGNPIPLDDSSVWRDTEAAKEYAKNGATAYVGQQLTIIDSSGNVTVATISAVNGNLLELANRQELSSLDSKIGDLDANDVGLGNVANVLQYSDDNPPPYPISAIVIDGLEESGTTIAKIKINDNDELSIKIPASNDYLPKNSLDTLSVKWENSWLSAQFLSNMTTAIPADAKFTDTKNTAGSTQNASKLFLIGATSQGDNLQTYSNLSCYVGSDSALYSKGNIVANKSELPYSYASSSATLLTALDGYMYRLTELSTSAVTVTLPLPTSDKVADCVLRFTTGSTVNQVTLVLPSGTMTKLTISGDDPTEANTSYTQYISIIPNGMNAYEVIVVTRELS